MKKITTLAAIACLGISTLTAQTQRTILYEEFTGENCGPCAGTNPYVDAAINPDMPGKIILLRYQCNIPSAPGAGSLYADNPTEVGTRQTYYAVPFAPYARFNGQHLPDPQAGGNDGHAVFIDATYYPNIINDSAINNAPFAINLTHSFNAAVDSVIVNLTVTAAMAYTSSTLKLQVSLSESEIHFAAPTGSNGEKDFYHVMRKMIPGTGGTALQSSWTNGANQSFTLKAKIPAYIKDKSKIEIVAFVEEQRTGATLRRVHNAAYSAPQAFANDASATAISGINSLSCATTLNPIATITNTGNNTITTCTVTYQIDAQAPNSVPYSGSIAPGATATVAIPAISASAGTHTLTVASSMPNGSTDINPNNDAKKTTFSIIGAAINAPIVEPFTTTTFPPTNWTKIDVDNDNLGWTRVTATGSSSGGGTARVYFYAAPAGTIDELYLPYNNLGTNSSLTFYTAGAPYTSGSPENDKLEFMISTDCGQNWSTLYSKSGGTLYTAAATTSNFVPNSAGQWRMETVALGTYDNQNDLLMKFVGTSDYGNNVYVDDVNLTTTTGIQNHNSNVLFSTVYPNPALASANVLITLSKSESVKVSLVNMLGQNVFTEAREMAAGDNHVIINTSALAGGLYHVVISSKEGNTVLKLTVNN